MSKDIKVFRLADGSEVVGELTDEDDKDYVVTKALSFRIAPVMQEAAGGKQGVSLSPLPVSLLSKADERGVVEEVQLLKSHVIFSLPLRDDLVPVYLQLATGIQIASANSGMTGTTASIVKSH